MYTSKTCIIALETPQSLCYHYYYESDTVITVVISDSLNIISFQCKCIYVFLPFAPATHNSDLCRWNYYYNPHYINCPDPISFLFVCICFACFFSFFPLFNSCLLFNWPSCCEIGTIQNKELQLLPCWCRRDGLFGLKVYSDTH